MSDLAITPDGARYLAARPPAPFHLRVLIPWLCQDIAARWLAAAWCGLAAMALGIMLLAPTWQAGVAAALLAAALPMVRFNIEHPVLVDLPALGLATLAAGLWHVGWWPAALLVVLLAGAAKETAPVFAALFAWTPVLLLGLVVPLIVRWRREPGDDVLDEHNAWVLAHPIQAAREYHDGWLRNLDPRLVAPWGAAVVALAAPTWQLAAVLAVAYAQLLIATDTVRLYQWAAPVVALAAVAAVPWQWWPVLIVATAFNPLRGDGL